MIFRCSSISKIADKLREVGCTVEFLGIADQKHVAETVSRSKRIIVPSRMDDSTLFRPKSEVVTEDQPTPNPQGLIWYDCILVPPGIQKIDP